MDPKAFKVNSTGKYPTHGQFSQQELPDLADLQITNGELRDAMCGKSRNSQQVKQRGQVLLSKSDKLGLLRVAVMCQKTTSEPPIHY